MNSRLFRWLSPALALGAAVVFVQVRATAEDAAPAATTEPVAEATGSITVTVVDANNKPVEGVSVSIVVAPARHAHGKNATTHPSDEADAGHKHARPKPLQTDSTNSDGIVKLTDLPQGTYVVQARVKHGGQGHVRVTISAGQSTTVTVELAPRKNKNADSGSTTAPVA